MRAGGWKKTSQPRVPRGARTRGRVVSRDNAVGFPETRRRFSRRRSHLEVLVPDDAAAAPRAAAVFMADFMTCVSLRWRMSGARVRRGVARAAGSRRCENESDSSFPPRKPRPVSGRILADARRSSICVVATPCARHGARALSEARGPLATDRDDGGRASRSRRVDDPRGRRRDGAPSPRGRVSASSVIVCRGWRLPRRPPRLRSRSTSSTSATRSVAGVSASFTAHFWRGTPVAVKRWLDPDLNERVVSEFRAEVMLTRGRTSDTRTASSSSARALSARTSASSWNTSLSPSTASFTSPRTSTSIASAPSTSAWTSRARRLPPLAIAPRRAPRRQTRQLPRRSRVQGEALRLRTVLRARRDRRHAQLHGAGVAQRKTLQREGGRLRLGALCSWRPSRGRCPSTVCSPETSNAPWGKRTNARRCP